MEEKVRLKLIMQKEQIKEETEVHIAELYISSLDVGWSLNGKHPSNLEPLLNRLMQLRFTMTLMLIWMESQWKASFQLRTSIKSAHATRFHHPGGGMIIPQMYRSMNVEMVVQNHSCVKRNRNITITSKPC